jgi:hypothetical protein
MLQCHLVGGVHTSRKLPVCVDGGGDFIPKVVGDRAPRELDVVDDGHDARRLPPHRAILEDTQLATTMNHLGLDLLHATLHWAFNSSTPCVERLANMMKGIRLAHRVSATSKDPK